MRVTEIAPGVYRLPVQIVNVYFIGKPGGEWTLIDAGMPGSAAKIRAAAASLYGPQKEPQAIVLTHGHFDHVGALSALADEWNVPVYAHKLEWPYLTGRDAYPPPDPTVGGAMPFLSRFFPKDIHDLSGPLRELPESGSLPFLPDWELHFTPGHSPGHVSLFRPNDRTLIAGDAFITVNMDSWYDLVTQRPEMTRPPTYYTCDWDAAQKSVARLAALNPLTAATGHGSPLSGEPVAAELRALAARFPFPPHGRYVSAPALTDAQGVEALPPPAFDSLPRSLGAVGLASLIGITLTLALLESKQSKR